MADAKLKVTFVDIEVTKDGDPIGKGNIYYSFKVDGAVVTSRSSGNPYKIGSGDSISLGASSTVTKSGATGTTLVVAGSVSDADTGKDETDSFSHNYTSGDNWGTSNPHTARLTDRNLDVTVNYIIERV